MSHVHWWLFGLSFATGLVLTLVLLIRPAKRQVSEGKPAAAEAPTTKIPVAEESPTTKIRVVPETPTTKIPVVPDAPYGPGSARAAPDGSGPAGWLVKGRSDTKLYYTPDDPTYDPTAAQVWFPDEASAVRAGFRPWRESSRK